MSSIKLLSITLLLIASASQSHQSCSSIEPPEHGSVKIGQNKFYHFSCEDGYIIQGERSMSCNSYNRGKTKPKCIALEESECRSDSQCPGRHICVHDRCIIGCRTDENCAFEEACINGVCQNPCSIFGACGRNANCKPINHNPECSCPVNFRGNPNVVCEQGNHYSDKFEDDQLEGSLETIPYKTANEPISHSEIKYPNPPPIYTNPTNGDPCINLQCEQLCLIRDGVSQCKCCGGFKLNSDHRTCRENIRQKINMNACLREHKKVGDVVLRQCPEGYTFDYGRKGCIEKLPRLPPAPHPVTLPPTSSLESCSVNNGGCQHSCVTIDSRTFTCTCQNGYKLHPNGKHCIDVNECSINNFDCSHRCVNLQGTAFCTCPRGFTLHTDKKTCIDIDECSQDDKNHCHHYCENIVGSYRCSCKPGYVLIEGYICEGCRRNSFWSYDRNACVDCPKNSHSDSEGKTSRHDCVCDSGYTGNPGDYVPCEDIDECSVNNFDCSHTCINIPGSAYCICPSGFMLGTNSKTCIDIDECSTKNGGCEGLCINTNGSFHCACPEGFTASSKDRYSCDDIDECSENNGGCEHLCNNYRGGFFCACKPGYHLDSTLRNCTDIQCPKLPLPHYSHMECKYKNMTLPEEDTYRAGTKCSFSCEKGFKNIKDHNKMKCQDDGKWKGMLPECKSQSCPPLKVPENADIHPAGCHKHGAQVKEKCTFSCHAGYKLVGSQIFTCKNNLTWSKEDIPVCTPVKIQPVIKCPEDIEVTVLQGETTLNIAVPEPTTNVEYYEVHPSWIIINESVEFPVGVTQLTFTAYSNFNTTAQCGMTVTILDKEPPVFHSCPDSITIEGANGIGELVTWDEPVVTDNVKLVSVFSLLKPNTTLIPGTYLAEYVATDSSGNIAKCSFNISIVRMNCTDLRDPAHGRANCMEWMFGKLCSPECDDGYMRNPEESVYYSCDDSGVWEPNELISECLPFTQATSSACQDGFELKKAEADILEQDVCIACPSNAVWSPTTRKCEK